MTQKKTHIKKIRVKKEFQTGKFCPLCGREFIFTFDMPESEKEQRIQKYEDYVANVEGDIDALDYVYIWCCETHGVVHEHCDVIWHLDHEDRMPKLTGEIFYLCDTADDVHE